MLISRLLFQFPTWMQHLYRGVIWRGNSQEKIVYLTFDDGPVPEVTLPLLDILDRYHIHATFFWVGENVFRYGDVALEVYRRGHTIGNHTFNHLPGYKCRKLFYMNNVDLTEDIIRRTLGDDFQSTHLFRPPYGRMKLSEKSELRNHFKIVLWDLITHDYNPKYMPQQIVWLVRKFVRNGSIIVFHDSEKARDNMLTSLPMVIEYLQQEGYHFGTL